MLDARHFIQLKTWEALDTNLVKTQITFQVIEIELKILTVTLNVLSFGP